MSYRSTVSAVPPCRLRQLAAAAALAVLPATCVQAMPADKLYALVAPSVWMVLATNDAGAVFSLGSAVVTAPETLITNCHVLKDASGIRVRREARELPARLEYPDVARDLCQLRVPGLLAPAVRIAALGGVAVGQKVYAIGDPRGLEATLSDGLVSSLRRDTQGTVQYIQTSAPVSQGSSGGGLFDEDGGLIGITSLGISSSVAQNLNFARPAEFILQVPARGQANLVAWRAGRGTQPAGTAASLVAAPVTAESDAGSRPAAVAPAAVRPAAPAEALAPAMPAPPVLAPAVAVPAAAPVPEVPVAAAAIVAPAPVPVPAPRPLASAPDADAHSLALFAGRTADMQAAYEEFLGKGLPRAFAVSVDGHFAIAYGARASGGGYAADVPARAMEYCQLGGGQGCTLFAVDGKVVYGGP